MKGNLLLDIKGEIAETNQYGDGTRYAVIIGKDENSYRAHIDEIFESIKENPFLDGITVLGKEPFEYAKSLYVLLKRLHEIGLDSIVESAYTLSELKEKAKDDEDVRALLNETDTLIDGTFVKAEDEDAEIKGIFDLKGTTF